jgi:hypothetical protein
VHLFLVSVDFAPPPPDAIGPADALSCCDAAGVLLWRRAAGFVWCPSSDARRGDALAVRGPFNTLAEAAADACACLGLSATHH